MIGFWEVCAMGDPNKVAILRTYSIVTGLSFDGCSWRTVNLVRLFSQSIVTKCEEKGMDL